MTALRRDIPLVLLPESEEQVLRIVRLANQLRTPLYPLSTGKNWGLGSKLPVESRCVLLDLSRMRRILQVDEDARCAVIEPGVTQAQLADYLTQHHPNLTLNLTGSFAETSIVGNILERGDGIYARVHDLLGLDGVLGNGAKFSAGGSFRYAAGPDLPGLFCQSNFGVVTKMTFRLLKRPERRCLFWAIAADPLLERLVDTYAERSGQRVVLPECVNIGYANRFMQASARDRDEWLSYAVLDGTAKLTSAAADELHEAFAPFCSQTGVFHVHGGEDPRASLPPPLHPVIPQLSGVPDFDSLRRIYQMTGTTLPADSRAMDADHTPFGMKCYVGLVPPRGESARLAASIVRRAGAAHGLNIKVSFFGDGRMLATIHFVSTDEGQVFRAEQAELDVWNEMTTAGFLPCRASIDQMPRLARVRPALFHIVRQLKAVLDPNQIIAPGRYCMLVSDSSVRSVG